MKTVCCSNKCERWFDKEWIIPKKFERATDKQIKCAYFICNELGMNYEPLLKRRTWEFINKYLDAAKQSREANFECWCEENAHWLPEYF